MNKLNFLDKLQRFTIFLSAIVFFIFAAWECIDNYFALQTARSLEVLQSKDFLLPEITVCLDQTMKPEALNKYGYTSPLSYILGPWQGKDNNETVSPEKIYEDVLAVKSIYDIFDSIQVSVFVDEFTKSERIDITSFTPKVDLSVGEGRCYSLNYPAKVKDRYVTTVVFERWEKEGSIGNHVNLKIGHPGQVYTRELETVKVALDSKTHIFLANPTAQILLAADAKSSCSDEMSFGFDQCFDESLTNMLLTEGGCTPPYVENKTNLCNSKSDWEKFHVANDRRDSLVKSHRFRMCPRPCSTMKGNVKFVTEIAMKHCDRCGTFSGNKTLQKLIPQGADLSRIILTIKEEFEVTRSFFAYTPLAFFAEIGGYLGLFIGYSLVSIADLGSWIVGKASKAWKNSNSVDGVKVFTVEEKKQINA